MPLILSIFLGSCTVLYKGSGLFDTENANFHRKHAPIYICVSVCVYKHIAPPSSHLYIFSLSLSTCSFVASLFSDDATGNNHMKTASLLRPLVSTHT